MRTSELIFKLMESVQHCTTCGENASPEKDPKQFDNWRRHSDEEAHTEYERESPKTEHLGQLWKDGKDFVKHIKASPLEDIPDSVHKEMDYATHHRHVDDLKDMTSQYRFPRDVGSIMRGYHEHAAMPAPIVLKHTLDKKPRYRVFGGNTRMAAAELHGVKRKAVVMDVTDRLRDSGGYF